MTEEPRKKPKYYEILWGGSTATLSEQVNRDMKFGWEPIGGAVECDGSIKGEKILIQTMVKYE